MKSFEFNADELFEISIPDSRGIGGVRWVTPSVAAEHYATPVAATLREKQYDANRVMLEAERIRTVESAQKCGLLPQTKYNNIGEIIGDVWTVDDDKMVDKIVEMILHPRGETQRRFSVLVGRPELGGD